MESNLKNIAEKIRFIKNNANLVQSHLETTTVQKETEIDLSFALQNTNRTFLRKAKSIIQSYEITLLDEFKLNYLVLGFLLFFLYTIVILIFTDLFEFLLITFNYFFQTTFRYFLFKLIKFKRRFRHHHFYVSHIFVKTVLQDILRFQEVDSQA
jgi:hypothetical protein